MAVTRRRLLGAAAASGATVGLAGLPSSPAQAGRPPGPEVVVGPDDPRYPYLVTRGYNGRFAATPDEVRVVYDAGQVEQALESAVRAGKRIGVRSGGHCFEPLVDHPGVRMLVDLSPMRRIHYDRRMDAFAVEAGATLGELYRALYLGWGVTVPAGVCPSVGVGGHIAGGGYGWLARSLGLSVDHLYAVEVVVVGRNGRARTIVATRRARDPHRDLWWAHTGGGGGNFGIVTKYWFRSRGAGGDPTTLLPRPPAQVLSSWVTWPWDGMTEENFTRLVGNHGAWHLANSDPGNPYCALHSALHLNTPAATMLFLEIRMDATVPGAGQLLDDYVAAVGHGVTVEPTVLTGTEQWLDNALTEWTDPSGADRLKSKGGHLRKPFTGDQVRALFRGLTDPAYPGWGSLYLASYGGQVSTVPPAATASAQRNAIFKLWYSAGWADPAEDDLHVGWVRKLYRDVYAATGGVPVPNDNQDGSFINYPDVDLRDPEWNTSGVPWSTLYYKDNYPRLQRIKRRYDPRHVFQHPLSIEPA